MDREHGGLTRRVRYGIPGIAIATTVSSGVTAYWCREPLVVSLMILLLTIVAGATTAIIVSDDF